MYKPSQLVYLEHLNSMDEPNTIPQWKDIWTCLDWLIWVNLLTSVLGDCLEETMKTAYDIVHKLFSAYFRKFSKIDCENNLNLIRKQFNLILYFAWNSLNISTYHDENLSYKLQINLLSKQGHNNNKQQMELVTSRMLHTCRCPKRHNAETILRWSYF